MRIGGLPHHEDQTILPLVSSVGGNLPSTAILEIVLGFPKKRCWLLQQNFSHPDCHRRPWNRTSVLPCGSRAKIVLIYHRRSGFAPCPEDLCFS